MSDTLITDSDFYTLTEALLHVTAERVYLGVTKCKGVTLASSDQMIKLCRHIRAKHFCIGLIFLEGYTWDVLSKIDQSFKENPAMVSGARMNI